MASAEPVHPEWTRRRLVAERVMLPWIGSYRPLEGTRVLDYGCGQGSVTVPLAALAGEVVAVDIDAEWMEMAHGHLQAAGVDNVEATCHPPDRILDELAARSDHFDIVLFYAVLEHMTLDERLRALELAAGLTAPGGAIVVCETPNRLIPYDWHSSFLPFFTQLPDELALRYYDRAEREDFKQHVRAGLDAGEAGGLEALRRFGRGVSYHEFELVFGDLARHVISSSYEPELGGEREIHGEELALARVLEQAVPDVPAAFSRFWLDLVISPEAVEPPPTVRPWSMHTAHSVGVAWTVNEALYLPAVGATIGVDLPAASRRLVIASYAEPRRWQLTVSVPATGAQVTVDVERPEAGNGWVEVELPAPAERVDVSLSHGGYVTFLGYEA